MLFLAVFLPPSFASVELSEQERWASLVQPQQYVSRQDYRSTNVLNGTFFQVFISFVNPKFRHTLDFCVVGGALTIFFIRIGWIMRMHTVDQVAVSVQQNMKVKDGRLRSGRLGNTTPWTSWHLCPMHNWSYWCSCTSNVCIGSLMRTRESLPP